MVQVGGPCSEHRLSTSKTQGQTRISTLSALEFKLQRRPFRAREKPRAPPDCLRHSESKWCWILPPEQVTARSTFSEEMLLMHTENFFCQVTTLLQGAKRADAQGSAPMLCSPPTLRTQFMSFIARCSRHPAIQLQSYQI